MLVRYHEDDQPSAVVEYNRALRSWEQLEDRQGQKAPAKPEDGVRIRLRIDLTGVSATLDHVRSLWPIGERDSVVISPRWTVDSRKPVEEQKRFTPTVRQLLFGAGAMVTEIGDALAEDGSSYGYVDIEVSGFRREEHRICLQPAVSTASSQAPPSRSMNLQMIGMARSRRNVVSGLRAGAQNALFDRITGHMPPVREAHPDAIAGQSRFMDGLRALQAAGLLHGFEQSKQRLIGDLAAAPSLLVQGPPGTGKSLTAAYAILARMQGAMAAGLPCRVIVTCKTHAAVDELLRKIVDVLDDLAKFRSTHRDLWDRYLDIRLLELPLFRFAGRGNLPDGVIALVRDSETKGDDRARVQIASAGYCIVASALGGIYRMAKDRGGKGDTALFQHRWCDLLVLDEASQINLPEAIMGALALEDDGQLIVIGDHRQMPPIVQNDWEREVRRTFAAFRSYESLFLTLRDQLPEEHQIRFQESFRVHSDIAEFLRKEIYQQDEIAYFSRKTEVLPLIPTTDDFVAAILHPDHPLTVVVHEEIASQNRNIFEQELMRPVLEALAAAGFDPRTGLGVVVPHTAQRAALRAGIPVLTEIDSATGQIIRSAVDTVERFQGAERVAIVVGATESDPLYLLANSKFLFDPRRLNVAISRAKSKLILVGSRSIFDLFSTDEDVFASAQLWKNLLEETCTVPLWEGEREGHRVQVWGNVSKPA